MRELKDYFCNYEQSKELKALGFNEPCVFVYNSYKQLKGVITSSIDGDYVKIDKWDDRLLAPLRSQALDFFRDKKILGEVRSVDSWDSYTYGIWMEDCMSPFFEVQIGINEYSTYHEAESALIDKLIELEKEAHNGN